ncbi:hypothetical protein ACLOJK_009840 [Asimina triloba]
MALASRSVSLSYFKKPKWRRAALKWQFQMKIPDGYYVLSQVVGKMASSFSIGFACMFVKESEGRKAVAEIGMFFPIQASKKGKL